MAMTVPIRRRFLLTSNQAKNLIQPGDCAAFASINKGSQCSSGRSKTQVLKPAKAHFQEALLTAATRPCDNVTLHEIGPNLRHSVAGNCVHPSGLCFSLEPV